MFGLRSARSRAIVAGVVLVVLLVGFAGLAAQRVHDLERQHNSLQQTSAVATALEQARARLFQQQVALSALVFSNDLSYVDTYHEAAAALEQDLSQARTGMLAEGDAGEILALDDLTEQIGAFNEEMANAIPTVVEADPETRLWLASAGKAEMESEVDAFTAELDRLAETEQNELAAKTAAADRAAETTLWLFIGFGIVGFLVTAGTVAMLLVSVVRPLASLRAKARAITAGGLQVRAEVSGPEEIASLARDFNEMMETIWAKTEEYIATTNLTGDIIVKTDREGTWIFLNDAARQFYGKPREELLGAKFPDYVHPEDVALTVQMIRDAIARKEEVRGFVNRQVTPMGTRVVEWNGCPFFDEEGQYTGIQVTGRDITERGQMEEALRQSEENYRRVVEDSIDGIGIIEGLEVRFVNRAVVEIFGYESEDEMLGRPFSDFLPSEWQQVLMDRARARQAGEEVPSEYELRALRKDGTTFDAGVSVGTIDYQGRPAVQAIIRDITGRKKAEEALRTQRDKFEGVIASLADGLDVVSRDYRVHFQNKVLQDRFGGLTGKLCYEGYMARETPCESCPMEKAIATGTTQRVEMTGADGREYEVTSTPFQDIDGETKVVEIARDITERKRVEEALRESEERFRSLTTSAPIGIFLTDVQGRCTYANPCLLGIAGLTLEESLGHGWSEVIHPDDRNAILKEAKKAGGQGRDFSHDIRILTREGQLHRAHIHTTPMFSTEGKVIGRMGVVEDITERKQAEEALQDSEERLKIVFEFAPDAYYLNDLDGKFVDGNKAAEELIGYKKEELIGKSFLDLNLLSPEQLLTAAAILAKNVQGLPSGPDELALVRRDGSQVPLEIRTFPVRIGDQTLVLGIARDITERKRAEDAIAAKTEEYVAVTNLTRDIIGKVDEEGRWVFLNDATCEFFGKPRQELLGTDSRVLIHPEDLELSVQAIRKAAVTRQPIEGFVNRQVTPMGMRAVEWNASPFFDEDGRYAGIQMTGRDITQRKQMEEALRESETRYRLLAENTSDLIWTMDLGLRYTYMSPSVTHMRGYSVEEIVGSTVAETMTPASLEAARKTLAEELAMERMEQKDLQRSRKLELEMYCKDGSTIWTEMNMKFLRDSDGNPVGILGVTRDISERKRAEEEREKLNAELEVRAITDSLTDLYDHAHFYQRLAEEIDRSKRYKHGFAVMMMDVDDFKRFNDSRGHQAGDEMLRLVAECIRSGLRRSDIAFRYGGDEFVAILPHADAAKARAAVSRMNERITKRVKRMDGEAAARLSLSAGVACFPDDGTTTDDLVRVADAALYSAKWVARARDIMGQREDIQSLISALVGRRAGVEGATSGANFRPEALHEQQARIVSSVASSITVALRDAGVTEAFEDPDLQVLATVGAAAEIKDRYIRGHPERASEHAVALAGEMGLSPERVRDIRIAGLLHDIGKVTVSEGILNKPGKLTRREFDSIKDHPIVGATLVSQVRGFERLVPIIRHHHERFDGNGYPDGLAGEEIPLEACILGVVDVFDALTHQRSYRKALSREEAIAELERGAGTHFHPAVVEAFLALLKRRGDGLGPAAQAASKGRQRAAARVPGRGKG